MARRKYSLTGSTPRPSLFHYEQRINAGSCTLPVAEECTDEALAYLRANGPITGPTQKNGLQTLAAITVASVRTTCRTIDSEKACLSPVESSEACERNYLLSFNMSERKRK